MLYVLLGGTQTIYGPLLGAAVFTLLPEVLRGSAQWRYVIFAVPDPRADDLAAAGRRHPRSPAAPRGLAAPVASGGDMTAPRPILALEAVSKRFGGLSVIQDLSFAVMPGERVALIGPNGAGKTTAFNLITGVYPLDAARILLDGAGHHAPARAQAHPHRARADVPEHPPAAAPDGDRERHGRRSTRAARRSPACCSRSTSPGTTAGGARRARRSARPVSRSTRRSRRRPAVRHPEADRAGARAPRASRALCCSTSRPPA